MTTIANSWAEFRNKVYKGERLPYEQERQVYLAFLAGITVARQHIAKLSLLPENEAVLELLRFDAEMRKTVDVMVLAEGDN